MIDSKTLLKKYKKKQEAVKLVLRQTPNNFFVSITHLNGQMLAWTSFSRPTFSHFKVLNEYVLGRVAQSIFPAIKAKRAWIWSVNVRTTKKIRSMVQAISRWKIYVREIFYDYRTPYNGCRGKKTRRL